MLSAEVKLFHTQRAVYQYFCVKEIFFIHLLFTIYAEGDHWRAGGGEEGYS